MTAPQHRDARCVIRARMGVPRPCFCGAVGDDTWRRVEFLAPPDQPDLEETQPWP